MPFRGQQCNSNGQVTPLVPLSWRSRISDPTLRVCISMSKNDIDTLKFWLEIEVNKKKRSRGLVQNANLKFGIENIFWERVKL